MFFDTAQKIASAAEKKIMFLVNFGEIEKNQGGPLAYPSTNGKPFLEKVHEKCLTFTDFEVD